jgi:hypothetical protein
MGYESDSADHKQNQPHQFNDKIVSFMPRVLLKIHADIYTSGDFWPSTVLLPDLGPFAKTAAAWYIGNRGIGDSLHVGPALLGSWQAWKPHEKWTAGWRDLWIRISYIGCILGAAINAVLRVSSLASGLPFGLCVLDYELGFLPPLALFILFAVIFANFNGFQREGGRFFDEPIKFVVIGRLAAGFGIVARPPLYKAILFHLRNMPPNGTWVYTHALRHCGFGRMRQDVTVNRPGFPGG